MKHGDIDLVGTLKDGAGLNGVSQAQVKAGYDHSQVTTGNPHSVTKVDVSLGNVTNDAQLKASALQTTITNDDAKVPSSGAVVDYVAANAGSSNPPFAEYGTTFVDFKGAAAGVSYFDSSGTIDSFKYYIKSFGTSPLKSASSISYQFGTSQISLDIITPITFNDIVIDPSNVKKIIWSITSYNSSTGAIPDIYADNSTSSAWLYGASDTGITIGLNIGSVQYTSGSGLYCAYSAGSLIMLVPSTSSIQNFFCKIGY